MSSKFHVAPETGQRDTGLGGLSDIEVKNDRVKSLSW